VLAESVLTKLYPYARRHESKQVIDHREDINISEVFILILFIVLFLFLICCIFDAFFFISFFPNRKSFSPFKLVLETGLHAKGS